MTALRGAVSGDLDAGRPDRALDRLLMHLEDDNTGLAEALDAHVLLAHVAGLLPRSAFGPRRAQAATRLGVRLPPTSAATGWMDFPAVSVAGARLVRVRVRETKEEADVLPSGISAPTVTAIHDALAAARALLPAQGRDRRLEVVLDADVEGSSLGLAVGLAALSQAERLPIPDGLLATGAVAASGAIRAVRHMTEKLRLRSEARPEACLMVPTGQEDGDPWVLPVSSLREARERIGAASSLDLDAEARGVDSLFRGGEWPDAARRAEALLREDGLLEREQAQLLMIVLAAANHRGDTQRAAEVVEVLRPLLARGDLDPSICAEALAHVAVRAVDALCASEAEAVLRQAEGLGLRDHASRIHLRGAAALAAILRGDLEAALSLRQENAEASRRWPDERPRCLGDLADIHLRRGEIAGAAQAIEAAMAAHAAVSKRRPSYLRTTKHYLNLHAARVARAQGDAERARGYLDQPEDERAPKLLYGLERALLLPERSDRLLEIERVMSLVPRRGMKLLEALRLRARLLAGDMEAQRELAECLGTPGAGAEELCRRLPY